MFATYLRHERCVVSCKQIGRYSVTIFDVKDMFVRRQAPLA